MVCRASQASLPQASTVDGPVHQQLVDKYSEAEYNKNMETSTTMNIDEIDDEYFEDDFGRRPYDFDDRYDTREEYEDGMF